VAASPGALLFELVMITTMTTFSCVTTFEPALVPLFLILEENNVVFVCFVSELLRGLMNEHEICFYKTKGGICNYSQPVLLSLIPSSILATY